MNIKTIPVCWYDHNPLSCIDQFPQSKEKTLFDWISPK